MNGRVLPVGNLSGLDRGQNLVPMPPKEKSKLGKDGRQPYLGRRVLPAEMEKTIEASIHAQRFLAMVNRP
jgi:hypothetical protein